MHSKNWPVKLRRNISLFQRNFTLFHCNRLCSSIVTKKGQNFFFNVFCLSWFFFGGYKNVKKRKKCLQKSYFYLKRVHYFWGQNSFFYKGDPSKNVNFWGKKMFSIFFV